MTRDGRITRMSPGWVGMLRLLRRNERDTILCDCIQHRNAIRYTILCNQRSDLSHVCGKLSPLRNRTVK